MKWVLSHQSTDYHKWLLHDSDDTAQLTYNSYHHSIRIKSKSNRLFFLEVKGFFHKKILLRSEYGVIIGESQWQQPLNNAMLLMNEQKYFFEWNNNNLSLFDKNLTLLSSAGIEHAKDLERAEQFALIFSLTWIIDSNIHTKKSKDVLMA